MRFLTGLLFFSLLFFMPHPAAAQTPPPPATQTYEKAQVLKIERTGTTEVGGRKNPYQVVRIRLTNGKEINVTYGGSFTIAKEQLLSPGDTVVVVKETQGNAAPTYLIQDKYRLTPLLFIILAFFALVIGLSGKKGVGAILGLAVSLGVILFFIVPQIMQGRDPVTISILGSLVILFVSIYLAHGFTKQTSIAVGATAISLFLTGLISVLFVHLAKLSGLGSEDAVSLQQGFSYAINFQGLLLGSIIIGALGVLDDVTTTQSATISELVKTDPKISFEHLVQKGFTVGKEHITSVVNTLVLAYAGASIGIFIFLILGTQNHTQPLWVMLNSELIVEEIIRTLAGSVGLILAVPITTVLAAFFAKNEIKIL